ncbi:MAG: glycoside hydrolase family 13 protein [Salinispira sp.]
MNYRDRHPLPIQALHIPRSSSAYAADRNTLHLRLQVSAGQADHVRVVFGDPFYWHNLHEKSMPLSAAGLHHDWFEIDISLPHSRYAYYFVLETSSGSFQYGEFGLTRNGDTGMYGERCFHYQHLSETDIFLPPAWVSNSVFYLIFPDRFRGTNWDVLDVSSHDVANWGGTLRGVINSLEYIRELGVSALYFTPIFTAGSYHRYDTTDYYKVDPMLGTNEDLREMIERAHALNIRVVLDAVFNHCGSDFPPFQDVLTRGKESPYADWFHINTFPIEFEKRTKTLEECGWEGWLEHEEGARALEYEAFAFTPFMPRMRTGNPEVQNYFINVVRYWMRECDIDGWRLDVADEVSPDFWRAFRRAVKEKNPNAYIVGEVWYDSRFWLDGTQFDAVMNYPVKNACMNFFVSKTLSASDMRESLSDALMRYSWPVNVAMMNLIESHDTDRFLTAAGGDRDTLLLAYAFIMMFPGTPMLYYGTEVGMIGKLPHGNRLPMNWDENSWDQEILSGMKELCALRRNNSLIGRGAFHWLNTENEDIIAFSRSQIQPQIQPQSNNKTVYGERVFVYINRGQKKGFVPRLPEMQKDLRGGSPLGDDTALEIPAKSYRLIGT